MSRNDAVAVVAIPAAIPSPADSLSRLGRMIAFFLTAGFAYPNVMTDGMDLTKIQKAANKPPQ
jgi:hypothetical protein